MDFLRNLRWLWVGAGAVAGWFVLPPLLKHFGVSFLGSVPAAFDPWNANYGTYRPVGFYGIGQAYKGRADWAGTLRAPQMVYRDAYGNLRGPILQYRGQKMGSWEGQTGEMGQFGRAGKDILPFGIPYEYRS